MKHWIKLGYRLAAPDLDLDESTVFEIGGPDRVAYADLMRESARRAGLRRAVIRVPLATRRVFGVWLTVVTPAYASIGRELIESVRNRHRRSRRVGLPGVSDPPTELSRSDRARALVKLPMSNSVSSSQ
jgi:hypothetical protein